MQRAVPPTPLGHLVFVLHTHLPWVLGHGRWPHGEAWLYEATAECYLPILRLLDRLEEEGRKGSITIGITPVLSEMLATPRFREGFLAYLEERTNRAEADQREFDAAGDDGRRRAAAAWSDFYGGAKADFVERYNQDLLSAFTRLQNRDRIEIIVSAATHGYLPLLGRDESVNAQLATGIASYRRSFGRRPRGIWLPECAYRPGYVWSRPAGPARAWLRPGLEELLGRHGIGFFFVDSHLVAGGAPIGTYEDRFKERRLDAARDGTGLSPNEPYALSASGQRKVAILARDPRSGVQVWSADYGYPGDGATWSFIANMGWTACGTGVSRTGSSPCERKSPTTPTPRRSEPPPMRTILHRWSSRLSMSIRRPRAEPASSSRRSTRNSLATGGSRAQRGWKRFCENWRDTSMRSLPRIFSRRILPARPSKFRKGRGAKEAITMSG